MQAILRQCLFLSQWIRRPRKTGAIAPSSPWLSKAIAKNATYTKTGFVIELGGGTGSLTCALLKAGVPEERLIVIESNPKLVKHLKKRFPKARICQHDAQYIDELMHVLKITEVCTIVSGLPLLSLPKKVRENILQASFNSLAPGGQFLQFTYGFKSPVPLSTMSCFPEMKQRVLSRIWRNIPPAVVWGYQRQIQTSPEVTPVLKLAV